MALVVMAHRTAGAVTTSIASTTQPGKGESKEDSEHGTRSSHPERLLSDFHDFSIDLRGGRGVTRRPILAPSPLPPPLSTSSTQGPTNDQVMTMMTTTTISDEELEQEAETARRRKRMASACVPRHLTAWDRIQITSLNTSATVHEVAFACVRDFCVQCRVAVESGELQLTADDEDGEEEDEKEDGARRRRGECIFYIFLASAYHLILFALSCAICFLTVVL